MHTTTVVLGDGSTFGKHVHFMHNSDFSGDCHVVVRGTPDTQFTVPCEALLQFAAEASRAMRVAEVERADWRTLLRLPL